MVQGPCRKDCPRRSISPNCHDASICPEWGEYMKVKTVQDNRGRTAKDALGVYYGYVKTNVIKKTKK